MRRLVSAAVKNVKHVPENEQDHEMRADTVQVSQEHSAGNHKAQILHVVIRLWRRRMVIEHKQNAGHHQKDEEQQRERAEIVGRPHAQRLFAHLHRKPMEEQVAKHRYAAGAVRICRPAPEDRLPNPGSPEIFNRCVEWGCHGPPHAFRTLSGLMISSLLTNNSPSAVKLIAKCGKGRGAGPSIFVPSRWNLLPWQGHAIMFASGFHWVMQPRCVHTADTA